MYTVYCDSAPIYDQSSQNIDLQIVSPTLVEEANASGSFSFVVPPNNKGYDLIKPMVSVISVRKNGGIIWKGRAISTSADFNNCLSVTCEGALGFLHDITYVDLNEMPWHGTVSQFLIKLIAFYNARVSSDKRIDFGYADLDEEPTDISLNYISVFDAVGSIADSYDLNIKMEYRNGNPTLYLVKEFSYDGGRMIEFGKNLLDISRTIDAADLSSVIIPRGAPIYRDNGGSIGSDGSEIGGYAGEMILDGDGAAVDENAICVPAELQDGDLVVVQSAQVSRNSHNYARAVSKSAVSSDEQSNAYTEDGETAYDDEPIAYVNISSVNDGNIYLTNEPLYRLYGRIEKVVDFEDIDNPSELIREAKKWLTNYQFEDLTVEVSLADLSIVDGSQPFKILTQVRCISKPHGMDRYFPITKIETVLDDPSATKITLNKKIATTLSQISNSVSSAVGEMFENGDKYGNTILQRAKNRARDVIRSCTNGYVTLVPDETGQYTKEIVISDQPDWESSARFWEWNQNGLGYFKRDGDQLEDCGLALTMNGEIVADRITTGTMYADRIRGGTLVVGDYDNQSGIIEVHDEKGGIIGSWTKRGIDTQGSVTCGSLDPEDKEEALRLKDGRLTGYKDGMEQGFIDTSISFYEGGWEEENYVGSGWVISNNTGVVIFAPRLGVQKEPFHSGHNIHFEGRSGTVKVVTSVWLTQDTDGRYYINTTAKDLEFYNGIMITDIGD